MPFLPLVVADACGEGLFHSVFRELHFYLRSFRQGLRNHHEGVFAFGQFRAFRGVFRCYGEGVCAVGFPGRRPRFIGYGIGSATIYVFNGDGGDGVSQPRAHLELDGGAEVEEIQLVGCVGRAGHVGFPISQQVFLLGDVPGTV